MESDKHFIPSPHPRREKQLKTAVSLLDCSQSSGLQSVFWTAVSLLDFSQSSGLQSVFWTAVSLVDFSQSSGLQSVFWCLSNA